MAWAVLVAGTACAGLSLIVPWVYYGSFAFSVGDLPGWPAYLVAEAVALGGAAVRVSGRWRAARTESATVVAAAVAAGVALWLMSRHGDASLFFDSVVPLVLPMIGPGGVAGLVGALAAGAVAVATTRREAAVSRPPTTRQPGRGGPGWRWR
jgi:hypothetical protein